jgi:putative transposase
MKQKRRKRSYSSDLTKTQWRAIKPLLPPLHGNQTVSLRRIINGIFYLLVTGCQWRNLPHDYPASSTVYYHFAKWSADGTVEKINGTLCELDRLNRGREKTPSAALIDSQSVKTSKEASEVGIDGGKWVKGHKRHVLTDTLGNLLKVVVTAANISDIAGAKLLLPQIKESCATIKHIWADGTYRGELVGWVQETLKATLEIVQPEAGQKGFKVLPKRWVVERTLAWLGNYRRLSKDYERLLHNSEGMIYLASIKTMLNRLAA